MYHITAPSYFKVIEKETSQFLKSAEHELLTKNIDNGNSEFRNTGKSDIGKNAILCIPSIDNGCMGIHICMPV